MSCVFWENLLLSNLDAPPVEFQAPPYSKPLSNTRAYPTATSEILIPDPKALRSMSRAAVFLANLCYEGRQVFASLQSQSPFAIGVYCAVENGPIDAPSTQKIIDQRDPRHIADHYRKFRNPKMYLKQLPNLAPAQMGISLGLQGPMTVFTHSTHAALHALDQAEWDLRQGVVEAALVCTANAFDDYVIVRRAHNSDPRTLNEAAGAMLLGPSPEFSDWSSEIVHDPKNYFGISDPLISILRRRHGTNGIA